jgi:hypothetical protein
MKNEYILGFDISTSIIGICVFKNKELYKLEYIDFRKLENLFEKSDLFKEKFQLIYNDIKDDILTIKIFIEDIMQSFSQGMSSAKTILQLAKFNGITSNIIYNISGFIPEYINVNSARKLLNIKIDKNLKKDKKEQILEWVSNEIPEFKWPEKLINRGVNKGSVKYEQYCYDMADAYVICKAGSKIVYGSSN